MYATAEEPIVTESDETVKELMDVTMWRRATRV